MRTLTFAFLFSVSLFATISTELRASELNNASTNVVVHSETQTVPEASWLRVYFGDVAFSGFEPGGDSFIRITSLRDNASQTLDFENFNRWNQRSAYFNGDTVLIEAIASIEDSSAVVTVQSIKTDLFDPASGGGSPRSICGTNDNRELTDDARVARVIIAEGDFPTVCTTSIIRDGNRCFLTSGGCGANLDVDTVIEFNAPPSFPDGRTLMHPSPDDQYVPDLSSVQFQTGGNGSDWGYFGCFPNSNTGLSPFEAQGDSFELAASIDLSVNDTLRGYGCGATVPPIFRTWSFIPKETTGPFMGMSGSALSVQVDATAGDSGASIIDDASGELVGILTNDGCGEFTGSNIATAVTNEELRKALALPLGICLPISIQFPLGRPELVHPMGTTTVQVQFIGVNGTSPVPDTAQFHYTTGGPYETVAMTMVGPDTYEVAYPAAPCGTFIDHYFSIMTDTGVRFPDQLDNPVVTFRSTSATGIATVAQNNFEALNGWDIQNVNVIAGEFVIGVPGGNGNDGAPTADYDGSGACVVTGLANNVDLDGGPTRLRSPTLDLSAPGDYFVEFATWFTNDSGDDNLIFQYSTTGGIFWTNLETYSHQGSQWVLRRYRLADYFAPNSSTRFRFVASDAQNNSRTEAAIDAFLLTQFECDTDSDVGCIKGDLNQDDLRNGADIAMFVDVLVNGAIPGGSQFCAADFDNDNMLETGDDLTQFVDCLLSGNCP